MQRGIRSALTSFALAAFGVLAGIAYAQAPAGGEPVKLGLIDIYGGGSPSLLTASALAFRSRLMKPTRRVD